MKFLHSLAIAKNLNFLKKGFLSFFLGFLVTLALPPIYFWPLAFIGFGGFFTMLTSCNSLKDSFKLGWWFGFGHFVSGLYWISFALLVDIESFGWLIPFALFGIPAVISIYIAILSIATWKVSHYLNGWKLVTFFACAWTVVEMLRGWLFTGFPWNLAGYIWTVSENILQFASIAGIWGLSLLALLVFTMPALLLTKDQPVLSAKKIYPVLCPFILLFVIFLWGGTRLNAQTEFVPNVKLRLIQANIPQNMKWEEEWRYDTVQKYLQMTKSKGFDSITHVIWPETALPFVISENSTLLSVIADVTPKLGALITGALRAEYTENGLLKNMWNSLVVVSSDGKLFSTYDKSHLVPFGEYMPFRSILPLEKITHGSTDFSKGPGVKSINAHGFPTLGGLVCYEIIFPGYVAEKNNRPGVLVNVTNDAWYGNTTGPYQHLQMARVRAVEEGLPVVRSANSGISAVIDAYGRITGSTKLGTETILDASLPEKIQITTFGRYGNNVIVLIIGALLLIICINVIINND